jgi:hypothetical protein
MGCAARHQRMFRSILAACVVLAGAATLRAALAESIEQVSSAEVGEIRSALRTIGLIKADVAVGSDGRVSLIGEYENRDEVETAFSAARAVVGLRRVAPTTPAKINYRLTGFEDAFKDTVGRMMKKPDAPKKRPEAEPTAPDQASPPRPAVATPRGPRTFGMIVGVGRFKNLPQRNYLEFAEKDAVDFRDLLRTRAGGSVPAENIYLLRHEQANAQAVHKVMHDLLRDAQAGDTVLVFASSHGVPNAMGKLDIVLYDTAFANKRMGPNGKSSEMAVTNRSTALTDDDFQQFISGLVLNNVRVVVILDTCYSGKTFAAVPGFLPSRTRSLDRYQREVEFSTSPSPAAIAELTQKAKDAKATRIVIVSASANEQSLETPDVGGGMFTQLYIDSLKKIHDYADAFDEAKPLVIRRARTVGHSQTPQLLVVPEEAVTTM